MGEFTNSRFDDLPLVSKRRIDSICARFETIWRHSRPRLEAFCLGVPESEQAALLTELLHIEVECRRRMGEIPGISDYLARFPDREAIIHEVLFSQAMPTDTDLDFATAEGPSLPLDHSRIQVPGYEVLEELGRGGMGVVYKARHLALNRLVALKFILSGGDARQKRKNRFQREAEVVALLRHPNIVQIYDIGEVEGRVFIALEYAEGGSLQKRMVDAPFAPRLAALLLEPLARAVQHAHRQGVIHRDLKPANILLAIGGDSVAEGNLPAPVRRPLDPGMPARVVPINTCTPKLTDFGLARLFDSTTGSEPGLAAGTPSYMAPEQAGGGTIGPATDIWALGANLYELLTGRPPFRAATAIGTVRLILGADPVPPSRLQPDVPRDLDTICLKCLQKNPLRRYASARELALDLRSFLAGEPIQARPASRLERLRAWMRRQPLLALLAAFVLMMAVIGTTVTLGELLSLIAGRR